MKVVTDWQITLNAEEAVQLRTALHIATRLTAVAPEPFNRPIFAAHFDKLHDSLRDADIGVLDGAIDFSEAIIRSLKDSIYSTDSLAAMNFVDIEKQIVASLSGKQLVVDFETFTRQLPPKPQEQSLPRCLWVVEGNFPVSGWQPSGQAGLHDERFPTAQAAGEAAQKYGCRGVEYRVRNRETNESIPVNLLKAKSPKQWIIQFRHDYSGAYPAEWRRLQGSSSSPGTGVYSSRNEAYRQMRARIKKLGYPAERYRVVPSDTPNGAERDRGYYLVEYWATNKGWVKTVGGPGFGNRASANGVYYSAVIAQEDIIQHGFADITYRVKWHPNKS